MCRRSKQAKEKVMAAILARITQNDIGRNVTAKEPGAPPLLSYDANEESCPFRAERGSAAHHIWFASCAIR